MNDLKAVVSVRFDPDMVRRLKRIAWEQSDGKDKAVSYHELIRIAVADRYGADDEQDAKRVIVAEGECR